MPTLVAGIHVGERKALDGRNKSGHDKRVVVPDRIAP